MKLSILIPSITERAPRLANLISIIGDSYGKDLGKVNKLQELSPTILQWTDGVIEILSAIDNRFISIGEKRQMLLDKATGKYIAYCDDDDSITYRYIPALLEAIKSKKDVITFLQMATIDGNKTVVNFDLNHKENEVFVTDGITQRMPFHVCAFKRSLAVKEQFEPINWGEDWEWCERVLKRVKTQHKIEEVLHIYTHDKEISRAYAE